MGRLLCLAAIVLLATIARAGDLPGAGSHTSTLTGDSHGWAAFPSRIGTVAIQHFPPRGVDALGRKGADDGSVRLAGSLAQMPEALAATDNRLYIVFPPAAAASGSARQVLYLNAERGSVDGSWVGESGGERLPSLPALPGDQKLAGFVATPAGLIALLGGKRGEEDQLLVLKGSAWAAVALPEDRDIADRLQLVALADGVAVVGSARGESGQWAWTRRMNRADAADSSWTRSPLRFPDDPTTGTVYSIRGKYILERRVGETVEVWELGSTRARVLASIRGVSRGYATAPLDQTGRLIIASRTGVDPAAGTSSPAARSSAPAHERLRIVEVSVQTGQVLFDGDAETQPPFSKFELKVLAAFLVCVMLAIVVFVLRPDGSSAPLTLPKGTSLAEPGRRVMGAMLDAGLAFLIATKLTGTGASEVMSVKAITGQIDGLTLYLATIGTGLVLGVFTEWVFGRSVGKSLTGMEVVRPVSRKTAEGVVEPGLARPSLAGIFIRNVVKWVLPPVAMSGLATPEHRHRGDTAGGTVVIVRDDPD